MSVPFTLVDPLAAASAVFLEQEYQRNSLGGLIIPQRILLLGQYNAGKTPTDNVPQLLLSEGDAANRYGLGSMLHIMYRAVAAGARGVPIYACPIPAAGGAAASVGSIVPTLGTVTAGTISLYIAGHRVAVPVAAGADTDAVVSAIADAINARTELPVAADDDSLQVNLTCKWAGLSGDDIDIAFDLGDGEAALEPGGITWVINDMSAGAGDPDIDTALAALGDTWFTWIVCPYTADAQLDDLEAAGEARVHPEVIRPFAGICGYNGTRADLLTLLASRNSPWTTIMPVDSSPNMKLEIAAAAAGKCASNAQSRPGTPYRGQKLPGILGGGVSWTYAERDAVVKAGGSTFRIGSDGAVYIEDLCTTKTENALGAADDSFRFTETIANLQAKLYSLEQVFSAEPFISAVVIADSDPPGPAWALRPKTAKAYVIQLIDQLWVPYGLTKNRDAVVAGIVAEIHSGNAGRIDVRVPDVFAAGLKILAGKLDWSFFPPVAA